MNYIRTFLSLDQRQYMAIYYPTIKGMFDGRKVWEKHQGKREHMNIFHLVFFAFSTNIELVMENNCSLDHINRDPTDS